MSDRLEEIKERLRAGSPCALSVNCRITQADLDWCLGEIERLQGFRDWALTQQPEAIRLLRQHGLEFCLSNTTTWEDAAFTLYSMVCEVDLKARQTDDALMESLRGEGGEHA